MSLNVCLPGLERDGKLDVGRSAEARKLYDELFARYSRAHGPETAAAMASQGTVDELAARLLHKKRNAIRQAKAQAAIVAKIRRFGGGSGGGGGGAGGSAGPLDPDGAAAIFDFDARAGHNDTVEGRRRAIKARAHAMIEGVLYKHHANIVGNIRDRAELDQLVDELFKPGSTGNASAAELADAWRKGSEYLRGRANEAGARIGKLEAWGLPQSHSFRKVREAGFESWRAFVAPLLDRDRMIDRATGVPFTDEALEPFLRDVWETIRSDGLNGIKSGAAGGKALANQHAEHRILHFTDGNAWRAYNERFGSGNAFDAMMDHVETMSRDIALMELLGPNPAATMRWMKDEMIRTAAIDKAPGTDAMARAEAGGKRIQRLYDEITGLARRPESENIALTFGTIRSLQTAAKLGGAMLSAVTDLSFQGVTRVFNGVGITGMIGDYAKLLNPASAADRRFAVRAGLIAEEWAHMTASSHRYLGEELTGEVARRLSNGVLRASGLSAWTQAGRWAFGMEFLGTLTEHSSLPFDKLNGRLRASLERHGLTAADWDVIRATPLEVHKGEGWILPSNIEDRTVGDKLLQMIQIETDYAVPQADLTTRAMMNTIAPRGTMIGEITKSALLFKTFPISVMMMNWRRIMSLSGGNRALYAAGLFGAMTAGGAIALQLKEIAKGKDPRPIDGTQKQQAEFWGAAVLQGGGLGIFGDFLGSAENRFGGGFAQTLAGPLAATVQNLADLTVGNAAKAARGDKTDVGKDTIKLIKSETPGGSLWYSRVAFERLVTDQLQTMFDPDYRASWKRAQRAAEKKGQGYWWEPGATAPERPPEL